MSEEQQMSWSLPLSVVLYGTGTVAFVVGLMMAGQIPGRFRSDGGRVAPRTGPHRHSGGNHHVQEGRHDTWDYHALSGHGSVCRRSPCRADSYVCAGWCLYSTGFRCMDVDRDRSVPGMSHAGGGEASVERVLLSVRVLWFWSSTLGNRYASRCSVFDAYWRMDDCCLRRVSLLCRDSCVDERSVSEGNTPTRPTVI